MIRNALSFESQRAQPLRARRRRARAESLERLAVGPTVRDGGIAGDASGQAVPLDEPRAREQLLDAFVDVPQPFLEPQHLLANDGEAEMSGLDDAGMHGADRNLVDAVARHAHER